MQASLLQTISLGLGSSWVAGVNLYATVATLGILGRWGGLELPGELTVLTEYWVIGLASGLYAVEFFADKIPWLDSAWDAVHTFIRIPAGAAIAATAFGDYSPTVQVIALLLGGSLALGSHATKAATRGVINMSPEPMTNIAASVAEDGFTFAYVALAYFAPVAAIVILAFGATLIAIFLPRICRLLYGMISRGICRVRSLGRRWKGSAIADDAQLQS
jgi:Domain of unknown function (DUF4126)